MIDDSQKFIVELGLAEETDSTAFQAYWLPMSERKQGTASKSYQLPAAIKGELLFTPMLSG